MELVINTRPLLRTNLLYLEFLYVCSIYTRELSVNNDMIIINIPSTGINGIMYFIVFFIVQR